MVYLKNKDIWKQIGISVVTIGLGIGSGEFILWPYLSSQWGFGLLWGALLGITLQVFLNIEIQRYSLASNQSIVKGAFNLSKYLGFWFIFSTIIGFGWPGFVTSSSFLIGKLFGVSSTGFDIMAVTLLIVALFLLTYSKDVYFRIEKLLKLIIPLSFIIILFVFIKYFDIYIVKELILGFVGVGNGYKFLPSGISLSVFLSAVVYSGSGGNLLLSQSYFTLEKKKFSDNFKHNRLFQIFENTIIFGGIGLLTILMLSYLGFVLTRQGVPSTNDLSFLIVQSERIGVDMGLFFKYGYILSGIFALFSVQLGVLDLFGRTTSEVYSLLRNVGNSFKIYRMSVLIQVVISIGIILLGLDQPLWLITIGAVFNAIAMSAISIVTLILNSKLKKEYSPNFIEKTFLILISSFYLLFFLITVIDYIK